MDTNKDESNDPIEQANDLISYLSYKASGFNMDRIDYITLVMNRLNAIRVANAIDDLNRNVTERLNNVESQLDAIFDQVRS